MTYLYILILSGGMSTDQVRRFEFQSQDSCLKSLQSVKVDNKKEAIFAAFCANEKNHRHYNSTWWNDAVKESKDSK